LTEPTRNLTKIIETVIVDSSDRQEISEIAEQVDADARAVSFKVRETYSEIQWAAPDDDEEPPLSTVLQTEMSFVDALLVLTKQYWGLLSEEELSELPDEAYVEFGKMQTHANKFAWAMLNRKIPDGTESANEETDETENVH